MAEVEIVSLVQELIPRYRLRADTDFACSNEDFIQTPRIDGSEFEALTNNQICALLDYYGKLSSFFSSPKFRHANVIRFVYFFFSFPYKHSFLY